MNLDFLIMGGVIAALLCLLGVVIRLIVGPAPAHVDDDKARWWWSIR